MCYRLVVDLLSTWILRPTLVLIVKRTVHPRGSRYSGSVERGCIILVKIINIENDNAFCEVLGLKHVRGNLSWKRILEVSLRGPAGRRV